VRVGMLALAVGRPGHSGVGASIGIVSAIGAPWRSRRRGMTEGLIRPDLTMYPGFSGGPLVDIAGRMIGMNTSGMGGNGLTIPVAVANPIVEQILTYGRIRRGYLGLTSQPVALPESIATTAGQETGLLVIGVESDSPAADAGVMVGDILIGIDGHPMRDTDDLREALSSERAGQSASLRIIRGGDIRELDTTIGER
jgi:S1-C subfamily serine protease